MTLTETIEHAEGMRRKAVGFILQEAYFITHSTRIKRGSRAMRPALARAWKYRGTVEGWAFVESFEVLRHRGLV